MRIGTDELTAKGEHLSPLRRRRRDTEADKAQAGAEENGRCHSHCDADDNGRKAVGDDVLYDNPVYILALNGAVYTVEINNGMPLKAEFRNPAYFRTGYLNREKNNLPKISSEYEYGYIQKDYIKNQTR